MLGGGRVVVSLSVRMCEVWEVWLGLWPPCPLKKPYPLFVWFATLALNACSHPHICVCVQVCACAAETLSLFACFISGGCCLQFFTDEASAK